MNSTARTVRRLRLRAPSEAAVRRTARVLEDALRTASLPDAGGRMLFVRRLALGQLAADAQPTTVALALEEAVARVGVEWRHGAESGASATPAVWFRDPLEAHVVLARHVLAGARPDAWYWPLAVPAWNRGLTQSEAVRAIAYSLAARTEAPAALPRWFAELVAAGYGDALAKVLREEDAVPLARAAAVRLGVEGHDGHEGLGVRRAAITRNAITSTASASGEAPAGAGPQARAGASVVHRLIASMLRAGGDTGVEGQEAISPPGSSRVPHIAAETTSNGQDSPAESTSSSPAVGVLGGGKHEGGSRRQGATLEPSPAQPGRTAADAATGERIDDGNPRARQTDEVPEPRTGPLRPEGARYLTGSTSVGGLLFLLNALERIGYSDWMETQPEWETQYVARRVLVRVLERLTIPNEDPGWELVRIPSRIRTAPRRFVAPSRWRQGLMTGQTPLLHATVGGRGRLYDPSGRLLLGAWSGSCPRSLGRDRRVAAPSWRPPGELCDEVIGAWEIAMRRWLRRFVGVSLSEVVSRPAAVAVTPTHIDFHFDLASADPRLRRAGLDLDPGWVAWFGRVVAFHYDPRDLS